jgi:hypothetical protein
MLRVELLVIGDTRSLQYNSVEFGMVCDLLRY